MPYTYITPRAAYAVKRLEWCTTSECGVPKRQEKIKKKLKLNRRQPIKTHTLNGNIVNVDVLVFLLVIIFNTKIHTNYTPIILYIGIIIGIYKRNKTFSSVGPF